MTPTPPTSSPPPAADVQPVACKFCGPEYVYVHRHPIESSLWAGCRKCGMRGPLRSLAAEAVRDWNALNAPAADRVAVAGDVEEAAKAAEKEIARQLDARTPLNEVHRVWETIVHHVAPVVANAEAAAAATLDLLTEAADIASKAEKECRDGGEAEVAREIGEAIAALLHRASTAGADLLEQLRKAEEGREAYRELAEAEARNHEAEGLCQSIYEDKERGAGSFNREDELKALAESFAAENRLDAARARVAEIEKEGKQG